MQIELGALADSLVEQLSHLKLSAEQQSAISQLDGDADAISRLYLRDLLPESHAITARQKIMKKIEQVLVA